MKDWDTVSLKQVHCHFVMSKSSQVGSPFPRALGEKKGLFKKLDKSVSYTYWYSGK